MNSNKMYIDKNPEGDIICAFTTEKSDSNDGSIAIFGGNKWAKIISKPDFIQGAEGWVHYKNGGFRLGGNGYFQGVDFRLATLEEIEKYNTISLAGYKATISPDLGFIEFGCKKISKDQLQAVKEVIRLQEKQLGYDWDIYVAFSKKEVTEETIDKLIKLLD